MRITNLITENKKNNILLESVLTNDEIFKIFNLVDESPENNVVISDINSLPDEVKILIKSKVVELLKLLQNTNPIENLEAKFAGLRSVVEKNLKNNKNTDNIHKKVVSYIKWVTLRPDASVFVFELLSTLIYFLKGLHPELTAPLFLILMGKQLDELQKQTNNDLKTESLLEDLMIDIQDSLSHAEKKVTYNKLIQDWNDAGKPTDTNAIADILDNYFDISLVNKFMNFDKPIINLGLNKKEDVVEKPVQEIIDFIKLNKINNTVVLSILKELKK